MKPLRFLIVSTLSLSCLVAQTPAASADKTPPSYDLKPQAMQDLQILQKHFADLAGVLPAETFAWRPADGVRSFAEVFLHVTMMNYSFGPNIGAKPLPGFNAKDYEKSITNKAAIIAQMNQSFDYMLAAIEKRTNKELQTIVPKFGPDASEGDLVFLVVSDAHEHMGQAVAYARMKGIVPPWTAAQQQKATQQ